MFLLYLLHSVNKLQVLYHSERTTSDLFSY